jgi:TPR repeat protein
MRAPFLLIAALAAWPTLACGGANVAEHVRPDVPTATDAAGGTACRVIEDRLAPLIVDWRQDQRAEIEAQMASGLPVVAYDCNTIRLLPDCHIDGKYAYAGITKDEQVVQLKTADEVSANLPKTGASLGVQVSADLARGASIDLALVMVGRRRTTRAHARSGDLVGECKGATHFIRGAAVGAFAMNAGSQAKVRSAADIFGGGVSASSISGRVQHTMKGAIAKCDGTRPGDELPPQGCDAIYRIELAAIDAPEPPAGAPAAQQSAEVVCPRGMVLSGGKCAKPDAVSTHVCAWDDPRDCEAQCGRGDAESCFNIGWLYENGKNVGKDEARAHALYQKSCDGGSAKGCRGLGWSYESGKGVQADPARAAQLYRQACDRGDNQGCKNLGWLHENGKGMARDYAAALRLYKQACDGGFVEACVNLGYMSENGEGTPKDLARASALYRQGCDGGNLFGCKNLGYMYESGRGVPQDYGRAQALYKQACDGAFANGCTSLGLLYENGRGVPKDYGRAYALYKQACDGSDPWGCNNVGVLYENGWGVPQDYAHAAQLYRPACDAGVSNACSSYGNLLVGGRGVAADRRLGVEYLRRGCKGGNDWGCTKLRELGESP